MITIKRIKSFLAHKYIKYRKVYARNIGSFRGIYEDLKRRRGKCIMCGYCCKGCYLLGKNNKCKEHNSRPSFCGGGNPSDFPISELQLKEQCSPNCGYWFVPKDEIK